MDWRKPWMSDEFLLERMAFAAQTIAAWTILYGKERAAEMIAQGGWEQPTRSIFETAWGW
jgi:hypothetical protein